MSGQVLNEKARIDLEVGNFEANSKKVVALLNQIKAAANNAGTGLGAAGNAGGAASGKMAALGKAMSQLRGTMNGVSTASNGLAQKLTANSAHLQQASAASQRNTQALSGNTAAITALASHVATLQASVTSLTAATNANTAATAGAGNAAKGAASGFSGLGGILAGLSFGVLAKEAIQLTDAYTSLSVRLGVTSRGIASSAGAMADVTRIARDTRAGLMEIGTLYSKVAMAGQHFGTTQSQVARVTETVSKGLAVMGASGQETASTILQLGQALASGRLQGDEFRSMAENAPALMEILAKSTGKPRSELKKLATEGKLTSDIIINAFGSQSAAIKQLDADFAKMPMTVAQSMTLFKNAVTETLGTSEQMTGATRTLAATIQALANNMNILLPAIGLISTAVGVGMVTNFVKARIAAGALGASLMTALGGPIGIAITALTIGLATLATQVYDSNAATARFAKSADEAQEKTGLTGVQALVAARGVASFGGKVGEAAGKLWDMAAGARRAAIDVARLNLTKAKSEWQAQRELTNEGYAERAGDLRQQVLGRGSNLGQRVAGGGAAISLGVRKQFGPDEATAQRARAGAAQARLDAAKTLYEESTKPMESFIPTIESPVSQGDGKSKKGGSKTDRVADFWKGLERERDLASMITPELEEHQKLFDLQDVLMDKLGKKYQGISAADEKRVKDLLAQTRAAALVVDINEKTRSLTNENATNEQALWMKVNGATDEQISKARLLAEFEQEAIRKKINLLDPYYLSAMMNYNRQIDKANELKLVEQGIAEVRASSQSFRDNEAMQGFQNRRNAVNAATNADGSTISDKDRKSALRKIDMDQRALENKFYEGMGEQISSVADLFGKKMGTAVDKVGKLFTAITKAAQGDFSGFGPIGGLAKMLTTNKDGSLNKLGEGVSDNFNGMLGGIGKTLGIGNKKTDKVANATQSSADSNEEILVTAKRLPDRLAGTLTAAMVGAGIGGMVGGKAGQIGGALGGAAFKELFGKSLGAFAGPLGGIVGGLATKVLGGLFKKTKSGSATLTGTGVGDMRVGGNSGSYVKAATEIGDQVQTSLISIAEQLGGTLGNFAGITIGKYGESYKVNTTGASTLKKGKAGVVDFDEDQAGAIAFAIKTAISRGAIQGLSDFAQKAIGALDSDSAVALVQRFKSLTDELDAMRDPLGAATRAINSDMDSLKKAMEGVGASAADLAQVETMRAKKRAALLEDELSPLRDFQKSLNTSDFGTPLATQLETARTAFEALKTDILAGKTVDKDKFTSAASEFNSLGASLYGSAGPLYQAIKTDVNAVTSSLMSNIEKAVTGSAVVADPTVTAVDNQTSTLAAIAQNQVTEQEKTNALLAKLVASGALFGGGGEVDYSSGGKSYNGQVNLY